MSSRARSWYGSKWIRPRKRLAIYLRDKMACVYCGASVIQGADTVLDHVVPHKAGGTNHESNLVTCCKPCNDSKNGRDVVDFLKTNFGGRKITPALKRVLKQTRLDLKPFLAKAASMLNSTQED